MARKYRELQNVIERAVISSENQTLKIAFSFRENEEGRGTSNSHPSSMEMMEKEHILRILEESNWRINGENGAAEKLEMHPNTLRSRLKKLQIYRRTKESSE